MRRRRTLIFVVIAFAAFMLLSRVFGPSEGTPEKNTADVTKDRPRPEPPPPEVPLPPSVAGRVVDGEGNGLAGVAIETGEGEFR